MRALVASFECKGVEIGAALNQRVEAMEIIGQKESSRHLANGFTRVYFYENAIQASPDLPRARQVIDEIFRG